RRHTRSDRDWSSDVCLPISPPARPRAGAARLQGREPACVPPARAGRAPAHVVVLAASLPRGFPRRRRVGGRGCGPGGAGRGGVEIGRASCRERVWGWVGGGG